MKIKVERLGQTLALAVTAILTLLGSQTAVRAITIDVEAIDGTGVLTPALETGKLYLFEVSGTYGYGHDDWADAEFLSYFGSGPFEFHDGFSVDVLDLTINGQAVDWLGGPNWQPHTYSPDHIYRYYVVGDGSEVLLTIADWHPLVPNDEHRGDNSGSLQVKISQVPDGGSTLLIAGFTLLGLMAYRHKR